MLKIVITICQLIILWVCQSRTINIFAAIQNRDEIYFSYLPYMSSCNYSLQGMLPGEIAIKPITNYALFTQMAYQTTKYFWQPVEQGFSIMALLEQEVSGQQGYILYNSQIKHFNRQLINYNIVSSNLTFYYCLPQINVPQMELTLLIKQQFQIKLSQAAGQILQNCPSVNNSNFVYLGNKTYLFVCGELASGFTFMPGYSVLYTHVIQFEDIGVGQYQLNGNQYILQDSTGQPQGQWNCMLLLQNQTTSQIYYLTFNENFSGYKALRLEQIEGQIKLVINRIWGQQQRKQLSRWMDVMNSLNTSQSFYFPGDIVSIFVSNNQNIFIQSNSDNDTYLCVFDNKGTLYWNISYTGNIIYYGDSAIVIYQPWQQSLYLLEVYRPIYTINVQDFSNESKPNTYSKLSVQLQCNQQNINIQYTILWTTSDYPSAYVICLNSTPIYTTDVIYGFKVPDKFLIIGPDFKFIVDTPQNIQIVIIDDSTLVINFQALQIVNFQVYNGNTFVAIVASNNSIYLISSKKSIQRLALQPCGFQQIQTVSRSGKFSYIITNSNGLKCQCTLDFSSCHIADDQDQKQGDSQNNQGSFQQISLGSNINQQNTVLSGPSVKKNIFSIINQGYYVSILTNNEAILVNIHTGKALDRVFMFCNQLNITNGDIYTRQFFDPILLLYCQKTSQMTQFVIRQNQIIFQREIPLYGFKTKSGTFAFFPASSFIFIAVDPIVQTYPMIQNCCVLRLNPVEYTVSTIIQVIEAQQIIAVSNYRNIDLILMRSNSSKNSQTVIKVYFPNQWITMNQSNNSNIISKDMPIKIFFSSPRYNFGACYQLFITFNLTQTNLSVIPDNDENSKINDIALVLNQTKRGSQMIFSGRYDYTASNYVCGPMFNSFFSRSNQKMKNLQIIQEDVLTKSKILGNIGLQFIQLIDPAKWNTNSTLNYLILVVSVQKMFVYDKILNNVQTYPIYNFTLPQRNCLYYLYQIINITSASLISNCDSVSYKFKSPILTINYDPLLINPFSYTYVWQVLPLTLREVFTIVRTNSSTLIVGILQGPMFSLTGKLYLCDINICSSLYVSTKYSFLLNYGAHYNTIMYLIITIDAYEMQIFINPQVVTNNSQIYCNYTINYTKFIQEPYCSVVKIINSTLNNSFITLSCSNFYYYMQLQFQQQNIIIYNKFARYSQCDLYDQFKPSVVMRNGLKMLITQCRQNDFTLKLQTYQTINSSTIVIYTGYIQIFILSGPLGPSCSNQTISPIKIVPLSSSMKYPLFITYQVNQNVTKFIYSQINGILIDNYLKVKPSVVINYQPISDEQQWNFPLINVSIMNQFHYISQRINTAELINYQSWSPLSIFIFVLFIIANVITVLFLVWFYLQSKKKPKQIDDVDGNFRQSMGIQQFQLQYHEPVKKRPEEIKISSKKQKQKQKQNSSPTRKNKTRPSQIQMYFVKALK